MSTPSSPQQHRVPPDQAAFPLESLTEEQREVLTRHIDTVKKEDKGIREPIWLTLVLARKKPATKLSDYNKYPDLSITAKEVVETFGLPHQQYLKKSLDVAHTSWWFDTLPTNYKEVSAAEFYRRRGCFFGYPKVDVEHFIDTTGWRIHPLELAKDGVVRAEEAAYMIFIPQRFDVIEHYGRAIKAGKNIRTIISDYSSKWKFDYLDKHADWIYQKALEECH